MSVAAHCVGDTAIAAQSGMQAALVKKPPPKRSITAKADSTQLPEPR